MNSGPRLSQSGPIEGILARLRGVRQVGPSRWKALCPAHSDHSPSLSIREAEDGKVLLRCWAGCGAEDVCRAIGLSLADLFPESSRQTRRATKRKASSEDTTTVELTGKFDRAGINAHRRLAVLYRTANRIFTTYGLEITNDEARWIRDLPYMEWVMDLLLSDDPELRLAGLQACGRWLI